MLVLLLIVAGWGMAFVALATEQPALLIVAALVVFGCAVAIFASRNAWDGLVAASLRSSIYTSADRARVRSSPGLRRWMSGVLILIATAWLVAAAFV